MSIAQNRPFYNKLCPIYYYVYNITAEVPGQGAECRNHPCRRPRSRLARRPFFEKKTEGLLSLFKRAAQDVVGGVRTLP